MNVNKMTKVQLVNYFESLVREKDQEIAKLTQMVDSLSKGGRTVLVSSKHVVYK